VIWWFTKNLFQSTRIKTPDWLKFCQNRKKKQTSMFEYLLSLFDIILCFSNWEYFYD
jgi:hypothetical protein